MTTLVKNNFFILTTNNEKFLDNLPVFNYNTPMKKYKKKPWSEAERRLLSVYYYHASIDEICCMIPDRSEQAIRNQVNYLKARGFRFK